MVVELKDIWDFHTDLRNVQGPQTERAYLFEQIDLPTAREIGGLFSATFRDAERSPEENLALVKDQVEEIRSAEGMTLVRTAADVEGTGRQVMHAEGVYFVAGEKELGLIDWMWEAGFRSLAPTYNEDNPLGGGGTGDRSRGLTPLGRDFLLEAWRKGFFVDCAHANDRTKEDMIDLALVTGNALHYTHGYLDEAVAPERYGERGFPSRLAGKLFETGGLIGLCPHPGMMGGSFERHLREIEALANLNPEGVVFGSDFAGTNFPAPDGRRMFPECNGVWGVPGYAEIIARAHGEDFARAYCGGTLRAYLLRALPRGG